MADEKARSGFVSVQLSAEHGAQIADGNLHGVGGGAFRLSADVVGGPGEDDGCGWVYPRRGKDSADV